MVKFLGRIKPDDEVILFVRSKTKADFISAKLALRNIVVQCIHGWSDPGDREQALIDWKSGEERILIVTDVASRGLDVDNASYVFNYDFPPFM